MENKTCAAGLYNAVIFLVAKIHEMNCQKHFSMCVCIDRSSNCQHIMKHHSDKWWVIVRFLTL